jgi:hypothetical protein
MNGFACTNKNIFSSRVLLNYTRTFTPVNYHLRLQCLYNCQEPCGSIHVFMASRGHYQSCRGVINAAFSAMRLVTFAQRGELLPWSLPIRPFGRIKRWICSLGPSSGRVSEGQLMEIKEETIRDLRNLVVVAGWSRNWGGRRPGFHCTWLKVIGRWVGYLSTRFTWL